MIDLKSMHFHLLFHPKISIVRDRMKLVQDTALGDGCYSTLCTTIGTYVAIVILGRAGEVGLH